MKSEKWTAFLLIKSLVAFLLLSVLLNFNYPAKHLFSWQLLQPSVDVWLLFILLATAACFGKRTLLWTLLPVTSFFLILRLFRIGDIVVPMYFNRPFNLYIDSGYLFDLYDLLRTSSQHGDFTRTMWETTALVLGIIIFSWYCCRAAAEGFLNKKIRLSFLVVSSLGLGATLFWGWPTTNQPVMAGFGRGILSIHRQLKEQQTFFTHLEKTAQERSVAPTMLRGLHGANVLLFIVESYGRIVFSRPEYRKQMETTMAGFARILDQHGFMAVSSYLSSPTYGGASWLAHSTLEFGMRANNDLKDTALLRSSLPNLASSFNKNGYRTVSVMPGTRFPYPEGSSYGYQQFYYAWNFNYQGRSYGWAPMPDQFVLDWVRRHEIVQRRQPMFIRYILISSHAAFSIQPQFIPNWDLIGDGSIYRDQEPVRYPIYWPDLKNAGDAYLRSLNYDFTTLGDYLAKYVNAETLIIIMGDHQPNLQLTGEGEPWSVPVHIISRNPQLLAPFRKRGYTPGLIPNQPPPHAGMETFLPEFLQDFR